MLCLHGKCAGSGRPGYSTGLLIWSAKSIERGPRDLTFSNDGQKIGQVFKC